MGSHRNTRRLHPRSHATGDRRWLLQVGMDNVDFRNRGLTPRAMKTSSMKEQLEVHKRSLSRPELMNFRAKIQTNEAVCVQKEKHLNKEKEYFSSRVKAVIGQAAEVRKEVNRACQESAFLIHRELFRQEGDMISVIEKACPSVSSEHSFMKMFKKSVDTSLSKYEKHPILQSSLRGEPSRQREELKERGLHTGELYTECPIENSMRE